MFEGWGGQIEGDTGWNGPPRRKLLALMWVTAELAEFGITGLLLLGSVDLRSAALEHLDPHFGRAGRRSSSS